MGSTPQQSRSPGQVKPAGYLNELARIHGMLDDRYDDRKTGKVQPIDGEVLFENLRQREEDLLKRRLPR